jgi:hypothetical protein
MRSVLGIASYNRLRWKYRNEWLHRWRVSHWTAEKFDAMRSRTGWDKHRGQGIWARDVRILGKTIMLKAAQQYAEQPDAELQP